jgi:hypothetical protein
MNQPVESFSGVSDFCFPRPVKSYLACGINPLFQRALARETNPLFHWAAYFTGLLSAFEFALSVLVLPSRSP